MNQMPQGAQYSTRKASTGEIARPGIVCISINSLLTLSNSACLTAHIMELITTTGKGKGNGVPKRAVSPNKMAGSLNLAHSAGCPNFARIDGSGSRAHHCSLVR